jgi:hypothetical protein
LHTHTSESATTDLSAFIDKGQNAVVARLRDQTEKTEAPRRLKRKIGYGDEEVAETKAKFARMEIDSQASPA